MWSVAPPLLLDPPDARPDVLSPAERQRLATFSHPDRRAGFVLGRTAARTLIAARLGCAPEAAPLAVGADGAPEVPGTALFLSIAHAGRGTVVGGAVLAERPVGLDLERITPRHPGLWRRMLSPAEHDVLDALGGSSDEAQTLLWSLKEAVLKGRRTGLRAGMRSVTLSALDPDRQRLTAHDADGGLWRLAYRRRGRLWVTLALAYDAAEPEPADTEAARPL